MSSIGARLLLTISALLVACVLSGCAAMSESECRNSDWYALGERDGLTYGVRPQIEQYAQLFYGERERGVRMGGEHP